MKYLKYALPVMAVVALAYYYFAVYDNSNSVVTKSPQTIQWDKKTDSQSSVTVSVTPLELGESMSIWKFKIDFDTHSGSLDDNPTEVITLYDDKDNAYKAASWNGAPAGGHHREGLLIFNAIRPFPRYVELKVRSVGGVSERVFHWDLN